MSKRRATSAHFKDSFNIFSQKKQAKRNRLH